MWTAAVLFLSRLATEQGNLWLVILAALLLALPAVLAALYTDTVALIHRSTRYRKEGILKRLTTGRVLSTVLWSIWSIGFGFASVFWFSSTTALEVVALFLSIGCLYLSNYVLFKITSAEMAAYYASATAIRWSRILVALLMTALFLSVTLLMSQDQNVDSLSDRFSTIADVVLDPQGSYVVQLATKTFAYLQEIRSYLISIAKPVTPWYLIGMVVGTFALFYNFNFFLSGFLIPPSEYRRVFSPLAVDDVPPPVSLSTTILVSTVITLFFFLLLPLISSLEMLTRARLTSTEMVVATEQKLVRMAEEIDNRLYKVGTHRDINEAKLEAFREQSASVTEIRRQAALAFDAMRANVDVYLDKYYSLSAEYLRIVGALTGTIEEHIIKDLTETLMRGKAIDVLDSTIQAQLARQPRVLQDYNNRVSEILRENRIESPEGEVVIVESSSLDPLKSPPENATLVTLNQRMGAAGIGAIGGFIAAKVVSKVAAKGAIKLAAKGMAKAATTKFAGGAAGAAVGAGIGSVVPVAGTLMGSVIGFTVGMVMGVSIDATLLKLEEYYSRDQFKSQILEAIDEQEREFNAMLSL